jgi:aspartate aminotransferase
VAALATDPAVIDVFVAAFANRRNRAAALLRSIPGTTLLDPDGAFYLFPDLSSFYGCRWKGRAIAGSDDMALFLLEEARAAYVPGSAFGDDRCLRVSFATADAIIDAALDRTRQPSRGSATEIRLSGQKPPCGRYVRLAPPAAPRRAYAL